MRTALPIAFLVTAAYAAPVLKESREARLVGRWQVTQVVNRGTTHDGPIDSEYEFTADGRWIVYNAGKDIDGFKRTYKLVDGGKSRGIDLDERDDPYPGLFRIEGDTLTLIFRETGPERPVDFRDGDGTLKFTMTRVKK